MDEKVPEMKTSHVVKLRSYAAKQLCSYGPQLRSYAALLVIAAAACTKVETTTTQEIRPTRFGFAEIAMRTAARDSVIEYGQRAFSAEGVRVQASDAAARSVTGGPVHFNAEGELPALDATITISAVTRGSDTRFRVFASALLEPGAVGGIDPRLTALVQRLARHIQ
jgi:hypothetical protein